MAVVAKQDIEILTRQLLNERSNILETMKKEYIEIDPALLHVNFVQEFEEKMSKIHEKSDETTEDGPISLDDFEEIVSRFDKMDKQLTDFKPPAPPAPAMNSTIRPGNHGMKRFGSMTDMNKTLVRTLSSQNLNSTKHFAEPMAPPPRMAPHQSTNHDDSTVTPKLTTDEIISHNAILAEIENRLNSNQTDGNKKLLSDIHQMYLSSFERLNGFFAEVQKIQSKMVEPKDDVSLTGLDQELLDLMGKLNKALSNIQFFAKNKNIYNVDGIKQTEPLLSDQLSDILEHFYHSFK